MCKSFGEKHISKYDLRAIYSAMVTHLISKAMKRSIIVIALIGCDSASKTTTVLLE